MTGIHIDVNVKIEFNVPWQDWIEWLSVQTVNQEVDTAAYKGRHSNKQAKIEFLKPVLQAQKPKVDSSER